MSSSGGNRGGASLTWPLALGTDESFQPTGIASNALTLHNPAAAVNGITLNGSATGAAVSLGPSGTDANIGVNLTTKGTGALLINGAAGAAGNVLTSNGPGAAPTWSAAAGVSWPLTNAGDETFQPTGVANNALTLHNPAAAVNGITLNAAATGNAVGLVAVGTDAAVGVTLDGKAAGTVGVGTVSTGQITLGNTGAPVVINANVSGVTINTDSFARVVSVSGSTLARFVAQDGVQGTSYGIDGPGTAFTDGALHHPVLFWGNSGLVLRFGVQNAHSSLAVAASGAVDANGIQTTGATTGNSPSVAAIGSDANVDLTVKAKGTGVINFGYAVTALGGGAAPTLGTIGGAGPATAAQNSWLAVKINGTTSFLPVWR